jgi:hypothetical protein
MLKLDDEALDLVMDYARPLLVEQRDAFLQAVAERLSAEKSIGPGVIKRVCGELQHTFAHDEPDATGSKYSRRHFAR